MEKSIVRLCMLGAAILSLVSATPAFAADWRSELGTFRVGLVAVGEPGVAAVRVEPFRLALAEQLGVPVEIVPMRDYPALIDAATRYHVEYSVFSASAFAAAYAMCECLEPMAIANSGDGTGSFKEVLIARQGGPASVSALAGKKVARLSGPALGGALLAENELKAEGLDLDGAAVAFGDSDSALDALADGTVDAVLGWSSMTGDPSQGYSRGTLRRIAEREGSALDYTVIWQSSDIPHRVHAVRSTLDGEAKTILRSVLTGMFNADPLAYDSIEPLFGGGFVAARQSQFDALVATMRAAGLSAGEEGK